MFDLVRFKKICKERGISQSYLFAKVGRKAYYSSDLKKSPNPPEAYIQTWAEILGTTPEYLKGETDDPALPPTPPVEIRLSGLTPEEVQSVRNYIDFLISQRR